MRFVIPLVVPAMLAFAVSAAVSQEDRQKSIEGRVTLGAAAFLDEDTPLDHFVVGGSARFYLTGRFSLEPEFTYMVGPGSDRDYTLVPNVAYDLLQSDKATVYVIGGAGLLHHREEFPGAPDPDFSTTNWTATGGIGVKVFLSDRIFVAPEFRFGWDPLIRISGSIGRVFDR